MSSIEELKKRAYSMNTSKATTEEDDNAFNSRVQKLKEKAKNGTVTIDTKFNFSDVDEWQKGAYGVGQRAYSYLSMDGYKEANTSYLSEIDSYLSKAEDVAHYLSENKDNFVDFDSVMNSHYDTVNYLRSVKDAISSSNKFYSTFNDEEDYNFWTDHGTAENRRAWYANAEKQIEELKANGGSQDDIDALKAKMRMYERGQYDDKGRYYGSKVVDDYQIVAQNADFDTVSANRDYEKPTQDEWLLHEAYNDPSTWYFDANGVYRDAYGNELAVDENGKWYNPKAQEVAAQDKLGIFLSLEGEELAEVKDVLSSTMGDVRDGLPKLYAEGVDSSWKYLNETEVGIYYYLLETDGQEAAYKYLDDMRVELNHRETLHDQQKWHEAYEDGNWFTKMLMNVSTFATSLYGNALGSLDSTFSKLRGEEINPYNAEHSAIHYTNTVRGATAKELDGIGWDYFDLGDLYQAGMSLGDSMIAMQLGGNWGGAFLAMGAAENEAIRLYESGASNDQIFWGSVTAGATEMIFESISIGELQKIKNMSIPAAGQYIKAILVQGGVEASEEILTEISNTIANAYIMGSQSDWAKLKAEYGGDIGQALMDKTLDVLHAGMSGFASGTGSGSVYGGVSRYKTNSEYRDTGRTIMSADGGVKALQDLAMDVAGATSGKMSNSLKKQAGKVSDAVTGKGIGKIGAALKNRSNATKVGRLASDVATANKVAYTAENQADIAKSLQRKGLTAETANDIASALVAQYNGQTLTKYQTKLLESAMNNQAVKDAISNIVNNKQSTMGHRQQKIRDFVDEVEVGTIAKTYGMSKEAVKELKNVFDSGKSVATAETVYEGNYEVSKDGKAVLDGKEVTLDGLRDTDAGVVVATADGQTADASSIAFPSKGHAFVYEGYLNLMDTAKNPVVANMSVDSKSKLAKAYDLAPNTNGRLYFTGANQAFWYGFEGMSLEDSSIPVNSPIRALNEEQIKIAYKEGQKAGKKSTNTQQSAIEAAEKAAVEKLGGKNGVARAAKKNSGTVILDSGIDESTMSKTQKASKDLAEKVAQAIGKNIHIYSGMQEYGQYDPATGEIWLNINGNISGKSMMAFALSHELVHMAKQWSPADYKAFADYLVQQYGKKGVSVEALVKMQMDNAIENGYELDWHEAYEEVIADACQRMLLDSDALQKMAAYRVKNPGKWQQIVDAIKKFINNVRRVFKGAEPDSMEAALFKDFDEAVKKELEQKFVNMVMNSSEHMTTIQNAFGKNTVVEVNADGEFTLAKGNVDGARKFLYNDATWEKGGRDTLSAALKAEGFAQEDIDAALTIMDGKHKLVRELAKQFPEQARINQATITTDLKDGHSVLSALVSNGDYPVNIDLLMVCKKRKAYQRVINRLCETGLIQQATVDALAIAEINKILGKYGFETACLGCFVESRRLRIQEWAETIVKEWNGEVKKRNPNAKAFGFGKGEATLTEDEVMQLVGELEGHAKNDKGNLNLGQGSAVKRMGVLLDKVPSLAKTLTVEDLITPDGLTALRQYDSNLFSMVKSRYGSNSPKFVQEFNPYNHELAQYGKVPTEYNSLREYLYAIGGARMQSFSDFIVENWFDYCQIVADLAARKLPMHTYTKEISLAKLFGLTGIKINMSLIPDVDRSLGKEYAGLTRNEKGELELIWADKDRFKKTGGKSYMQSINFADAIALQNDPKYSGNVGTIAVGVSKNHILMMLDDARIRMIIPYHSSGMNPIFADLMGTSYYTDYTNVQNTRVKQMYNSKGQKVSVKLDKTQTGKLTAGFQFNEVLQELGDARAAAEAYKEWCADASKHTITIKGETYTAELTPKFDEFAEHENYYKLLEDFNTYDCISEEAAPQGDVQQIYPENFNETLKAELKAQETHRQKQEESQAFDKAMGEIESYLSTHTKADTVFYAEQHGVKLSDKDKKLNAADKAKIADLRKGMKMSMPKVSSNGYHLSEVVEGKRDLLAFHNITPQLLQEALNRNGLVMPSLAITNKGMNDFGEISLLFDKSTIDPNQSRDNKLYGADAWTPTQTNLKKNAKFDTDKTVRAVNAMKVRIGSKYVSELLDITPKQFKETILQADGSIYDAYAHNIGVQTAYAMESGIISKIPTNKNGTVDKVALQEQLNKELDTDNGWRQYKKWLNSISDTIITSYDQASNEDILNNMKAQPASAKTFKLSETGELVVPAAEYGSIKDLRKNKSRLSENAAEAAKAVAYEFMALAKSIGNNTKAVVDAINTAFAARYNTADIMKAFRKQGINISTKTAGELQSLYKKAVELPTQYFEAKPQREVGLDEIKAVVMPADAAYAELKGKLEDMGIQVIEYDGTKESRLKALNSVENLKFSMPKVKTSPTYEELVAKKPIAVIGIGKNDEGLSYAELKDVVMKDVREREIFDFPHPNRDTEVMIFLTEKSFTHVFSNLTSTFGEDTILAMGHITEIIREAVLTHVAPPKNPNKAESRVFTFFAAIEGKNGIEPVKLTVKEYAKKESEEFPANIRKYFEEHGEQEIHNRLYDAEVLEVISIESAKKESGASASDRNRATRFATKGTPNSVISIADLLGLVNGEERKYIPLPAGTDAGYHAGDLGKAEFLHQQGYSRDTGHFGTGTYFVGAKELIEDGSTYANRPHHAVNFEDYNLYKIRNDDDGYKLHRSLRVIDGGFSQEFLDAAVAHKFEASDLVRDARKLIEEYDTQEWNEELEMFLSTDYIGSAIRAYTEVAKNNGIDIQSYDEWLTEQSGEVVLPSDSDYEYYKADYSDYLKETLRAADDARNNGYPEFRDAYYDLHLRFGLRGKNVEAALQNTIDYRNSFSDSDIRTMRKEDGVDSLATIFMKSIGYEGIDVRGTGLDNTTYGSVIYDINPSTVIYKTPNSRGMSNRQLLADAFDELVQNPKEREKMDEYRNNIAKVEEVQERLRKLRGKISELTKAKGDKAKIAEMNETAKGLADLIDKYDRKLLELEASKPLRDVLARARTAAYQEARERSEKSLKEYRQQVGERIDRAIEGRRKTEMRKKIRKTIRDLDKILNRGDKKRNVKEDMKDFVAEALSAAEVLFTDNYTNDDIIRNGFGVELSKEETKYLEEARGFMEELSNLPTGSYDAWQARQEAEEKLKSKLAYRMTMLKDAFFRERQRLNKAEVAGVIGNLADAYAKLETSEYAYVNGAYHGSVYQYLKMLQEDMGGAKVKDMTLGQLEELHKAYTMVLTTVKNANKMFAEELKQSKEQLANRVMMEVYEAGGEHGLWSKGQLARNQASWNNTKPIYAAERTGSKTFVQLVKGLFKGQYNWAVDMEEAKAFRQKIAEKYGFKNWDMEKTYKFTSSSGIDFELNLNQIMALYAYAKREQAHDHLLKGGFVFGKNTEVVVSKHGIKRTYLNKSAKAHNISDDIMDEIVSNLSEEQKGFVDEMQNYLSTTMGNKGNEVSMRLYGVKLFMEQFYFPLRSAGQFKEKAKEAEMKQQQGQISIANSGFTHATTPKASNPVVLDGFTDVWASHVNEMSLYHSMVLPMEDFRRVYNYASPNMEGQESASVNSFIENAYGDAATGYFDQLYKELNGGAIVDPRENRSKKWIGKFKKAAVFLSNSVWVQQFSAIGRATSMIDVKYFVGPKVDKQRHALLWEEVKKYAPVAIIKEMGGFDTHTGLSANDYLLAEEYNGKEKVNGLIKDKQYRSEVMGLLPAKADELTWCAIWEAVKRETKANNSDMDIKSEEFLKKAGERFSEVIEKTQVYDSVLARSANMRSKNGLMQMLTAFMAEPTTTVNMIEDALRKGNKKFIARSFGAAAASIIINNVLASLVYAMRDDDDDETFMEKYAQALTSGMIDDINPMTYYPGLKDIWSLFQGYDVERSDMAIYADIADALKQTVTAISKYDSEDPSEYYNEVSGALMSLLDAGASAFGIPLKNVRRDVNSYINTYQTFARGDDTTWGSFADAISGAALDTLPIVGLIAGDSKTDNLYDAIIDGDKVYVERLKNSYVDKKGNFDQTKYDTAVRKALRENDPRIEKAAKARFSGDFDRYKKLFMEIKDEGIFSFDNIMGAINAEINALEKKAKEDTTKSTEEDAYDVMFTVDDYYASVVGKDQASAKFIYEDLIADKMAEGYLKHEAEDAISTSLTTEIGDHYKDGDITRDEALRLLHENTNNQGEYQVKKWDFELEYGFSWGERVRKYRLGKISEDDLIDSVMDIEGETREAAEAYIDFLDLEMDNEDIDITANDAKSYFEYAEPAGIDIEVYLDYKSQVSGIKGEDKDGKTISGSKKKKVLAVIHSLPISRSQKDALYRAAGYSEKDINDAPWR